MGNAIALLGTSADPPTRGHQVLLSGLTKRYTRVATWASDNPMKRHAAPLMLRALLLKALVDQIDAAGLSLEQELSSPWALTTLQRAARLWPDQELVFVVGSDLAAQIPRWRQADAVLNLCRLAIAPRQGWPLQPEALEALKHRGASIELLDLAVPASASSDLRQAPRQDQVPQRVWPLLIEHGLYGLTPNRC